MLVVVAIFISAGIYMIFSRQGEEQTRQEIQLETHMLNIDYLYERIIELHPGNRYPVSIEDVVFFYGLTYEFIYGPLVPDDGTLIEVLELQRLLYHDDLLRLNSLEIQFIGIREALGELYMQGVHCTGFYIGTPVIDGNTATVRCVIHLANVSDMTKDIHLVLNPQNNRWQIVMWENVR